MGDVTTIDTYTNTSPKRKVFAYITHECRLLVFRHTDAPEARIQVPAGTLEPGESPASAVMREAREVTGLADLELVRFLDDPPSIWRHTDLHGPDGAASPIEFEFFWADLTDSVPPLIADHDWFVSTLEC